MASDDSAGRFTSDELSGLHVYATDGSKLGSVTQVYVDDVSDEPAWVTVKTGLFGTKESFIPVAGARRQGSDLHIPYESGLVKDAPRMESDQHLEPAQEGELYQHYGLSPTDAGRIGNAPGAGDTSGGRSGMGETGTGRHAGTSETDMRHGMAGGGMAASGRHASDASDTSALSDMDTAETGGMDATTSGGMRKSATGDLGADADLRGGPSADAQAAGGMAENGDHGLTLSEEQVRIGTEEHEIGRARLRKYIVTENVTRTIPVSHEEVRLVREPIAESERGTGVGRIQEEELEVTLHEERPTIRKEAVAVERVRLETEKITEQEEISTEVRREQLEYDSGNGEGMPGREGGGKHR